VRIYLEPVAELSRAVGGGALEAGLLQGAGGLAGANEGDPPEVWMRHDAY
jgi:hypothetical protein